MFFLKDVCELSEVLKVIYFVKQLLNVVCFIVPIGLIVMVMLDFFKNVIAKDEGDMKKNLNLVIKRTFMAVMLFLVPTIITFVNSLLGTFGVSYASCINNANLEKIAVFEAEEEALELQKEQEEQNEQIFENDLSNSNENVASGSDSNTSNDSSLNDNGKDSNFDFSKINQCSGGTVVGSSSGVKLRECIVGYETSFFQNFAITNSYVYFSFLSTKTKNGTVINRNKIVRISRSSNKYQVMAVDYAGHAQCFDVANGSGADEIYLNYFTGKKSSLIPSEYNNGVTCAKFTGKDNGSTYKKIPEIAIAIVNKGSSGSSLDTPKSLKVIKSSSYLGSDGKIDTDSYNSQVEKIGSSLSSYVTNAQIGVDEDHNQILVFTNNRLGYVYKLSDFKNGKLSLIKKFSMDIGYGQGVEIYGNYVYHYRGNKNDHLYIRKYNINTGKMSLYDIDISKYSKKMKMSFYEPEGITIYKGNLYVAIYYKRSNSGAAAIFYVDGI